MKNELLTIGPLTVYGYGAMIAVGILAALVSGRSEGRETWQQQRSCIFSSDLVYPWRNAWCKNAVLDH